MTETILHHYPTSTFSERVRLAFGLKRLAYRTVVVPASMPKPDLLPLTGGYRRTPVLQIGADIYCDTQLILRRLETLHPEPSLYCGGEGLATALEWWADKSIFEPVLGVVADTIADDIPADFVAERKAFGFPLAREDVAPLLHRHLQQGAAHLAWLADMLKDGRAFLLGESPCVADFAAYCALWLLRTQGGDEAEARLPVAPLREWYARITAIGHGQPVEMDATDAIEVALANEPAPPAIAGVCDASGLTAGSDVIVRADDTGRDPVRGRLLAADAREIVIRAMSSRAGKINLHFPRAGFDVTAA